MFPALRSAIAAGSLLAFARSLGEFGAIVFVSGNIPNQTLTAPVLITQLLNPSTLSAASAAPDEAAAVAAVLFGISAVVVLVTEQFVSRRGRRNRSSHEPPRPTPTPLRADGSWSRRLMVAVALFYVAALLVAPLVSITYYGLKSGLGTIGDTFRQTDVQHAFYLTFLIMLITVIVNTVFGIIVALVLTRDHFPGKRLISALVDLPLGRFARDRRPHGDPPLRARRLVRGVLRGAGHPGHLRAAVDGPRHHLHLDPVRDP